MEELRVEATGGVHLHVRRWDGEGRPFLLVHGLASNARMWDGVAERLAEQGHAVAAIDQRGHGLSDKVDEGYDFATVAADLVCVVESLGFERPVVAGQSWGGNVVVELAARHPELVSGIACVDGGWIDLHHFASWEECARVMAPPRTTGLQVAEMEAMLRSRRLDWPESGVQGALACFEIRDDGTVAPWLGYDRHLRILRAMWEQRIQEVLSTVTVPTLLIPCRDGSARGERKRAEVMAAEAALAVCRTHWADAHHDVHAQHPDLVAGLLAGAVEDGFYP